MTGATKLLVAALAALCVLYAGWFAPARDWVALLVFGAPPLLLALACWRGRDRAAFWAGVLALAWFSHGIMVAWTRPAERGLALVEVALSLVVVVAASWPALGARSRRRRDL